MQRLARFHHENSVTRRSCTVWRLAIGCLAFVGLGAGAADVLTSPTGEGRGATLYSQHCGSCHDSLMHLQGDRRTRSYLGVAAKVRFYSELLQLEWTEPEIDAVAAYLNGMYYHFPMPGVDEGYGR